MIFTLVLVEVKLNQILICTAIMLNDHSNPYIVLSDTRRASAAQLRINIHTRSRVISIAHPVLTMESNS